MSQEIDFPIYDEEDAVRFIKDRLPENLSGSLSKNQILEIIDLIFDYYESAGFLSLSDVDREPDERDVVAAVAKRMKGKEFPFDEIAEIVRLELAYEDTLNR